MVLRRALKGGSAHGGASTHAQAQWDTEIACNPSPEPGATAGLCPAGQTCAYFDENPSHDLMSFDNVGVAFIALLQAITFDDWTVAMYALMQSLSPYVVVYFLLIVVLGGFFVINLFLAVIFENFVESQEQEEMRKQILATATEYARQVGEVKAAAPRRGAAASPTASPTARSPRASRRRRPPSARPRRASSRTSATRRRGAALSTSRRPRRRPSRRSRCSCRRAASPPTRPVRAAWRPPHQRRRSFAFVAPVGEAVDLEAGGGDHVQAAAQRALRPRRRDRARRHRARRGSTRSSPSTMRSLKPGSRPPRERRVWLRLPAGAGRLPRVAQGGRERRLVRLALDGARARSTWR